MLGLAVGDAIGSPVEGLKGGYIRQLYGEVSGYVDPAVAWRKKPRRWRMSGLYSDDTQQAMALADALVKCRGYGAGYFSKLLCGQARAETGGQFGAHRGTGKNFRSSVRALLDGAGPDKAGLPTAGIGAMMRAAPCGLYFADDGEAAIRSAVEQGLITHRDPRALVMAALAAIAVTRGVTGSWDKKTPSERAADLALAAARAEELVERDFVHLVPIECMDRFGMALRGVEMLPRLVELPDESMAFKQIVGEANRQFPAHKITEPGQGFVMASGMSALFIAITSRDYEDGVKRAVRLGKDTDTMAAIVGAILGARHGEESIPEPWREGLINAEQVALRGEALLAKDAAGLGLKDIVKMEAELTRNEVSAREEFIERMEQKGVAQKKPKPKKPAPPPEPEAAEAEPGAKARDRRKKKKRKRVKAPWKQ